MDAILTFMSQLTDPEWIMLNGGLYIVVLIVFIETGLPFGFFLPGDSLLFIAGMVIANALSPFAFPFVNLIYWILLIAGAGTLGNFIGYWIGRQSDALLHRKKDSWLIKRKYLLQAKKFYDKNGGGAIVIARFFPMIRTFAPLVAGIVKMHAGKFSFYNVVGSLLWVISIVTAGYLLGARVWVQENLDLIILGIVVVTTLPLVIKAITSRKRVDNAAG
ncbi:MAG TPA: VTT domain-containing protein [Saprospiraceae bacterium]|mgnify:CR=1 FL=1|jgi:membrane-associated protein|nr:VTT domain-containing protein [Saprospiraceae bacterium]HQU96084.1 VTT domain-containing protein [Saprospiraceae bacterium]HQW94302.1 VTT domain-containing protein [Saprospiraceae bacterium]